MIHKKPALQSSFVRSCFIVIFSFVGGLVGIFVGNTLFRQEARSHHDYHVDIQTDSLSVSLKPGDSFPPEGYTDSMGVKGNFRDLLLGENSLVLFVDLDCQPCHDLLRAFQRHILDELEHGVRVVLCLSHSTAPIPKVYKGLTSRCTVVYFNSDGWTERYNLVTYPTIIGVDKYGFLIHVQNGYESYIDYELVEEFLSG